MHTITFYSFKGGVGRSMALVNIGAWLAKQGRRVLLVDFDLEAPGLETYQLPRPKTTSKGVVDYIYEHIHEQTPKSLDGYYYECTTLGTKDGALYLMPAGHPNSYKERLGQINFADLYANSDGFMLMENLKAHWEREVAPDYVLIDSRTGYGDIAGICTRQLPDTVLAMFIPTTQNVQGLKQIVRDIRKQNEEDWRKPINLIFVVSNIPFVDDERNELAAAMEIAKRELEIGDFTGVVHYYASASHFNQTIFTVERESTLLAQEFIKIGKQLLTQNVEDRTGVDAVLDRLLDRAMPSFRPVGQENIDDYLTGIEDLHSDDPELMFKLARVRLRQGLDGDAVALLTRVIEQAPSWSEPRLLRANLQLQRRQKDLARADLEFILDNKESNYFQVSQALTNYRRIDSTVIDTLSDRASFNNLTPEDKVSVLRELAELPGSMGRIAKVIPKYLDQVTNEKLRSSLASILVLDAIHAHQFRKALELVGSLPTLESNIEDIFNYAIAEWGHEKRLPMELFELVVRKHDTTVRKALSPNHLQCLALSAFITKREELAEEYLHSARFRAIRSQRGDFSCWTYEWLDHADYIGHLDEMAESMTCGTLIPPIVATSLGG